MNAAHSRIYFSPKFTHNFNFCCIFIVRTIN